MKQRKISKQKKKDRKESFRFLRQWVSEKEFFFFLFQLQKTFLLHLPVKDGEEDECDQCQRHQSIHVKQEEKKGTLKLFLGRRKKTGKTEKYHLFFFTMYYCFFKKKKSIRLTGKLIFDCYFHTEYFNSVRFLNFNTIVINKQIILPILCCNPIRRIVNNYFSLIS